MLKNLRKLYFKLFKHRRFWHMRHYNGFIFEAIMHKNGSYAINFNGKRDFKTPPLEALKELKTQTKLSIMASGPSIKTVNFSDLENTDIAFVNGSIMLSDQLNLLNKNIFFLVTDPNFIRKNIPEIKNHITLNTQCIFSMRSFYEFLTLDSKFILNNSHRIFIVNQLHEPYKAPKEKLKDLKIKDKINFVFDLTTTYGFSLDPKNGIFNGGTVVYSMLQIASYLKYSSIDIYGMDLNSASRFYQEHKPAVSRLDSEYDSIILPHLKLAGETLKHLHIDVTNKSKISRLPHEIIPKDL